MSIFVKKLLSYLVSVSHTLLCLLSLTLGSTSIEAGPAQDFYELSQAIRRQTFKCSETKFVYPILQRYVHGLLGAKERKTEKHLQYYRRLLSLSATEGRKLWVEKLSRFAQKQFVKSPAATNEDAWYGEIQSFIKSTIETRNEFALARASIERQLSDEPVIPQNALTSVQFSIHTSFHSLLYAHRLAYTFDRLLFLMRYAGKLSAKPLSEREITLLTYIAIFIYDCCGPYTEFTLERLVEDSSITEKSLHDCLRGSVFNRSKYYKKDQNEYYGGHFTFTHQKAAQYLCDLSVAIAIAPDSTDEFFNHLQICARTWEYSLPNDGGAAHELNQKLADTLNILVQPAIPLSLRKKSFDRKTTHTTTQLTDSANDQNDNPLDCSAPITVLPELSNQSEACMPSSVTNDSVTNDIVDTADNITQAVQSFDDQLIHDVKQVNIVTNEEQTSSSDKKGTMIPSSLTTQIVDTVETIKQTVKDAGVQLESGVKQTEIHLKKLSKRGAKEVLKISKKANELKKDLIKNNVPAFLKIK